MTPEDPEKDEKQKRIEVALTKICKQFEAEDGDFWQQLSLKGRKLRSFWHGIQRLAYDSSSKDYITPEQALQNDPSMDIDPEEYKYIINIFKAHGESVIAAISASLPYTRFYPKDADNPLDLIAASARSKASEFIQRENDAAIMFLHLFWILFTSNYAAIYTYSEQSNEFGTIKSPLINFKEQTSNTLNCPSCGEDLTDESEDVSLTGTTECPSCREDVVPESAESTSTVPIQEGYEEEPRTKQKIEVFSPLEVKVPGYIRKLRDSPYLLLEGEQHYTKMRSLYPEIAEKINPTGDDSDRFNRQYREAIEFNNANSTGLVTNRRWWLRPSTFSIFLDGNDENKEIFNLLISEYPNGVYAVFINELFAEAIDENLDEYWTLTESPLSETIHADPLGDPLVPIQEMKNEVNTLTIDTIGYGIGETFADPDLLDFDEYSKSNATPGTITPAKAAPGKALGDGFFTMKAASLSKEVPEFDTKLDRMGEFVVGDMPTVYGGSMQGGSKTLGEYTASQNRALQRLSTPWKVVNVAWAKTMGKAVECFKRHMQEDEHFVQKRGNSYVNVWIRMEQLADGEVGQVIPETSDQFPISYPQLRGFLMELLGLNNEQINSAIFHPENAGNISRILGFNDMYVPGDNDRNKQLMEISELVKGQPTAPEMDPMTGMPGSPRSSVLIEPDVDNHSIHIETLRAFINSPEGQEIKRENEPAYLNIVAHLAEHLEYMKALEMEKQMAANPNPEDIEDVPPQAQA